MRSVVRSFHECAAAIARAEWRTFNETGKFGGKDGNVSALDGFCGAAPAQMARPQVVAVHDTFIACQQNDFSDAVQRCSVPAETKHMLHKRRKARHTREAVTMPKSEEVIPSGVRRLALSIWRAIRKQHKLPNARGIASVVDVRCTVVEPSRSPHSDLWIAL